MQVIKGHGTENDFVVLPDLDGRIELTAELTRALCDRHAGIGADGVLRVVRTEHAAEASGADNADAPFFMDYRNADGSLAEMCGNGVRVFVRYLHAAGLARGDVAVATRGGVRRTRIEDDGAITVDMGPARFPDARPAVTVQPHVTGAAGMAVELPNPHVVVMLSDPDTLAALNLRRPPIVEPPLPNGQNVEFALREGERRLVMRVHERGVGETRSCGTGICAVVVAAARAGGAATGDGTPWQVDVPGGSCQVTWHPDGTVALTGPAVLVGRIDLDDAWLSAVAGPIRR